MPISAFPVKLPGGGSTIRPRARRHETEIVTLRTVAGLYFPTGRELDYTAARTISIVGGLVMESQGDPMPATSTISAQTRVLAGDSQEIQFRPGIPGVIGVNSVSSPKVARPDNGFLAMITLRRPGSTTVLAKGTYKVLTFPLLLSYHATAADLATPGDWTCEVSNMSLDPITFSTDVTFPIDVPLATASIDLDFLNLLLSKVFDAAAIKIHIESSDDGIPRTTFSVSLDVAALLKLPAYTQINIPNQEKSALGIPFVYRILNLDSDPAYPIVFFSTDLELKVEMRFDTASARLVAQNLPAPDINIELFDIEITIGFDGSFQPVCNASAHLAFNNIDFSSDVSSGVQDAINQHLQDSPGFAALQDKKQVRAQIDSLFIAMMRLGPQAQIQSYRVDGQTLTVTYFLRPT